jgi:hypothetical protein
MATTQLPDELLDQIFTHLPIESSGDHREETLKPTALCSASRSSKALARIATPNFVQACGLSTAILDANRQITSSFNWKSKTVGESSAL